LVSLDKTGNDGPENGRKQAAMENQSEKRLKRPPISPSKLKEVSIPRFLIADERI
jgi:hypothetical protein